MPFDAGQAIGDAVAMVQALVEELPRASELVIELAIKVLALEPYGDALGVPELVAAVLMYAVRELLGASELGIKLLALETYVGEVGDPELAAGVLVCVAG